MKNIELCKLNNKVRKCIFFLVLTALIPAQGCGKKDTPATEETEQQITSEAEVTEEEKTASETDEAATMDEATAGDMASAAGPALMDCAIATEDEFGGIYVCCTIDDFNDLGFEYGDSVKVTFSNGYEMEDVPYYNGYYTRTGEELLVAYPGYPYIKLAINNGDDLWVIAGVNETDTATVKLQEHGKYSAIQEARNIRYTIDREDYESDEVFANFRNAKVGDIKKDILYRSASPCDNSYNRAPYVDSLIKEAGVTFVLDLADDDERIKEHMEESDSSCDYFKSLYNDGKVKPIKLNANYGSQEFAGKLVDGLVAMTESEGSYLIHCTEGKDRTGFVCVLLECLCGADYDEIKADYMITYDNYYGITEESDKEKYDILVENLLDPMIQTLAGDNNANVRDVNLVESAERYLKAGGMTDEQISLLRDKLTK